MASNITPFPGPISAQLSKLDASLPTLLINDEWTLAEPLPASYRERLPEALHLAEHALEPVSQDGFYEEISELIEWAGIFDLMKLPNDLKERTRQITKLAGMYRHTLGDLPPDLLHKAIQLTMQKHSWSKLPLPGDVRSYIAEDIARRNLRLLRLKTAQMYARFEDPGPTHPDLTKQVEGLAGQAAAAMKQKLKAAYRDEGDIAEPEAADARRASYREALDQARSVLTGQLFVQRPKSQPDRQNDPLTEPEDQPHE
jgi:hypothetical protein